METVGLPVVEVVDPGHAQCGLTHRPEGPFQDGWRILEQDLGHLGQVIVQQQTAPGNCLRRNRQDLLQRRVGLHLEIAWLDCRRGEQARCDLDLTSPANDKRSAGLDRDPDQDAPEDRVHGRVLQRRYRLRFRDFGLEDVGDILDLESPLVDGDGQAMAMGEILERLRKSRPGIVKAVKVNSQGQQVAHLPTALLAGDGFNFLLERLHQGNADFLDDVRGFLNLGERLLQDLASLLGHRPDLPRCLCPRQLDQRLNFPRRSALLAQTASS